MTGSRNVGRFASMLFLAGLGSWSVIGAAGLPGQDSQSDQSPHPIRGTVVNSVTGEPIYRALVQIGGLYAALTDHEGHFEFDGPIAQGVPPWAMKPGFFPEDRFRRPSASSLRNSSETSVIRLVPEAIVSGTVTGEDGGPIENIPVQLRTLTVQDGHALWRQRSQTKTNAEGQYRFAELETGKYIVTTGFHIEGLAEADSTSAYLPARYPAAGGAASTESAIVLRPADHSVADFNPEVARLFPVTGTIANLGEGRSVGFRVETQNGDDISPISRFTARTGEFRIMLPEGSYQVTATTYAREGPQEARREITVPHGPVGGLSFSMQPYANIPVDLEINSINQPADGSGEAASLLQGGANIGLVSADERSFTPYLNMQPGRNLGSNDAATAGPMMIEHVSPGLYSFRAQPQSPWYVASASCGSVDLTHDELSIAGSAGCSIRVVLRNDSGSAHVTLRDSGQNAPSGGQPEATVYALPLSNLAQPVVYFNQQNGDYSADGLAPGRYLVLALDRRVEMPYRDPEAMRRYAGLGQEIVVTPNGKADVELSLASIAP